MINAVILDSFLDITLTVFLSEIILYINVSSPSYKQDRRITAAIELPLSAIIAYKTELVNSKMQTVILF